MNPAVTPDPRRWAALAVILTATFLALFDTFVVNVAAPSIAADLDASDGTLELVIAAYAFTYAVGLITGARLGDRLGRRRVFLSGMALFALAAAACAAAPTAPALVGARLLQGLGAAAMVPQVLATIQHLFGEAERPRAFSAFGAVAGAGVIAGQALGGVLLALDLFGLGWRAAFAVQLPIAAAALAAGARVLPRDDDASRLTPDMRGSDDLDLPGAALLTLTLALLLAPLTLGHRALLAAAPFAAVAFLLRQRRAAAPLLPPALLGDRAFVSGAVINLMFYAEISSFFLIVTLLLQDRLGLDALHAGLTFAPLGAGFVAASLARRGTLRGGLVLVCLTLAALFPVAHTTHHALLIAPFMLAIGVGNGCVLPRLLNSSLARIAPANAGAASGVLVTAQQVGAALGVAAVGALGADLALAAATLAVVVASAPRTARAAPDASPARA
ncbi:MFS transporter, partial [Conexibacter woesei]|uniref:MFS transporter n=1 Tax=Conexibacter woesei TaxID=191495 RepID=UPI0004162E0E